MKFIKVFGPFLDDANSVDICHSDVFFDKGDFAEVSTFAIAGNLFFAASVLVFRDAHFAASNDVKKIASGALNFFWFLGTLGRWLP